MNLINIITLYHSTVRTPKAGIIVFTLLMNIYNDVNRDTVVQTITSSFASYIGATAIMIFQNCIQAGKKLAQTLKACGLAGPVIFALPRGGVPVGVAIAKALTCTFDFIPLIKIPSPGAPMRAMTWP